MYRFLKNIDAMFESDIPKHVMYCYGIYQDLYDEIKSACSFVHFKLGLPSEDEIKEFASSEHKVIVLDDLLTDVVQSPDMQKLFVQYSHHLKLTVFFITQNMYQQGKCSRTIALNTAYYVLFKNYRDTSQLITLGRQLVPGCHNALVAAYKDATSMNRYGYLVIDMSPHTEDRFRWRTRIFPGEDSVIYEV
jgi:hypothetical protein